MPRAVDTSIATTPRGAAVVIELGRQSVRGELLAVGDSGLYVIREGPATSAAGQLVLVRYGAMRRVAETAFGNSWHTDGAAPDAAIREKLRLVSRFPQGLSPELARRLLDLARQSAMASIP